MLGDSKSWPEIASIYADVYGVKPKVERQGTLDELRTTMKAVFQKDPKNMYAWIGLHYQYVSLDGSTYLRSLNNERLGNHKPKSVKSFFEEHKKEDLAHVYH